MLSKKRDLELVEVGEDTEILDNSPYLPIPLFPLAVFIINSKLIT